MSQMIIKEEIIEHVVEPLAISAPETQGADVMKNAIVVDNLVKNFGKNSENPWWKQFLRRNGKTEQPADHKNGTSNGHHKTDNTHKRRMVVAVDSVSFEVKKGQILGFLGQNGAGKTTTMKILTGFMPARAGKSK